MQKMYEHKLEIRKERGNGEALAIKRIRKGI